MKVNEWVQTYWTIINIKPKTLFDYKGLYRRNLEPYIGDCEIDEVSPLELQTVLLGLPPQTSRHTLMVAKSIYREALLYKVATNNPTIGLRTPAIQMQPKKFLTWEQVDELDWGRYNNQVRFLALHGLRWSEAVAITEEDIHDGFVWVSKSFYGDVKSKTSNRKVPYLGCFEKLPAVTDRTSVDSTSLLYKRNRCVRLCLLLFRRSFGHCYFASSSLFWLDSSRSH